MNVMMRFTQRARRVLSLAQEAAESRGHPSITKLHMLLGLRQDGDGVAAKVLTHLGVTLDGIIAWLETMPFEPRDEQSQLDLDVHVKRSLEAAVDEARQMGHDYIGTEHLLLGMLRVEEGAMQEYLKMTNLTASAIRDATKATMAQLTYTSRAELDVSAASLRFDVTDDTQGTAAQFSLPLAALRQVLERARQLQRDGELLTLEINGRKITISLELKGSAASEGGDSTETSDSGDDA